MLDAGCWMLDGELGAWSSNEKLKLKPNAKHQCHLLIRNKGPLASRSPMAPWHIYHIHIYM
jgi:hypothetical protein